MVHDKNEKFDGHEESEYHFSDEEMGYDVESGTESDSAKQATSSSNDVRAAMFKKLTGSKRAVISVAVFVGLVFIVYKMVSGGSTTPSTDITPRTITAQQTNAQKNPAQPAMNQPTNAAMQAQVSMPAPAQPTQQMNAQPAAMPSQAMQTPPSQPQNPMPGSQPSAQQSAMAAMMAAPQSKSQQAMPAQQPQPPVVAGMPAMMPVQSAPPPQVTSASAQILNGQIPSDVQAKISTLSAQGDQAVVQLQAQYEQKINDYAAQNKALQDQVQTLNARVMTMENQMNQMIQALSHQPGGGPAAATDNNAVPMMAMPQHAEPKISYNVQAIIPGRAWLRSDGGETLTVAEGDMVKDLGRVTKIDPYDGIVEINTGSRVVSLSYGNNG